ncbi:predicted GTPase activator protein [Moesziomyces antarcticus T-34]|uniref:Predicted GTPase activator protein n=1 Tax=Pseudozyma antarctica (strain T-34) TaxID=1151754 RepID=M9MIQ0_PSEA3|nr:predicted GTPase activator protein [Moesziomyces antarcticus T-34]
MPSSSSSNPRRQASLEPSTSALRDHPSDTRDQSRRHLRRQLQEQCLQPSGLARASACDSRAEAWLELLDVSPERINNHKDSGSEAASTDGTVAFPLSSKGAPSIIDDTLNASVPLDKDGWQLAGSAILNHTVPADSDAGGSDHRSTVTAAQFKATNSEWKVVESKRTKRRKGGQSTPSQSPTASPDLTHSPRLSTGPSDTSDPSSPFISPHLADTSVTATPPSETLPPASPPPYQPRFPNLSERDVEQVAKDVDRSFIGPAFKNVFKSQAEGQEERSLRRRQLTHLVLTTLSRHPTLHYFQGYHDILSVVLLTLASTSPLASASGLFADDDQEALVELVAERISLHLIRDSMTPDLLPVMGQLKVLGNLLRLCDPPLAELVDRASPLPFFALPWLLTLLTHDAPNVAVMQRVLELVIAHGPSSVIYVCAAVLRSRRDEILGMDADELDDPAMLHAILSRLPRIVADGDDQRSDKSGSEGLAEEASMYTDPDVELPSLASDRALAASQEEKENVKESGTSISSLLQEAVQLMRRFELDSADVGAHTIMGPKSVLFTWSSTFTPAGSAHDIEWAEMNAAAEAALSGPTDAIVLDPHPPQPEAPPGSDEKPSPLPPAHVGAHHARTLALVGISGILVAALWTASQTAPNAAMSNDQTKRVLTLIVSLLSNFGRVVDA